MLNLSHRSWVALVTTLFLALPASQAIAKGSVIKVSLWDKGAMSMNMHGKGSGMAMMMDQTGATRPMGPMGITVSTHTVKAGKVTFAVENVSRELVHEMVLSPVKDGKTALPYDSVAMKVDEDAAGQLGEVEEMKPGERGALTIDLKPGKYILYCNIAGHYMKGMWTLITVK